MEKEQGIKKQGQVAWSMDETQLKKIGGWLESANHYYFNYNLALCFSSLRTCKFEFIHSLEPEEREKCKELEEEIGKGLIAFSYWKTKKDWYGSLMKEKEQEKRMNLIKEELPKLKKNVENYREYIMDLLHQYGYLSKMKKDKTKLAI